MTGITAEKALAILDNPYLKPNVFIMGVKEGNKIRVFVPVDNECGLSIREITNLVGHACGFRIVDNKKTGMSYLRITGGNVQDVADALSEKLGREIKYTNQ